MRRVTSVALSLAGAITAFLVGSCNDAPTSPTRSTGSAAAHIPVSLATASTASGATFTTDKDDYMPGDTLRLAGSGWQPGDSLDIHLDEDPQNHPPLDWMIGVDENGQFRDSSYIVQESDLGVTFALTATSRATGESATASFTDANPSVSVAAVVGSVAPGGSASYTVTVNFGGNATSCTTDLSITTALPTGASASFNPSSLTGANSAGNTPKTSTLAITTTASGGSATPPGTYTFTVQSSIGTGCNGNASTASGTLIVFGPATKLAFLQQPTNTNAAASIGPAVTVQVLDAGNRVVANSSESIGLAIGTNPGSGTLSGTTPQSAVNGVATFSDLSINKAGTGYTLNATSGALTGATSSAFNITVGAVTQLVFTTQPSGGPTNTAFSTQPVVQAQDAGGNVKATGTGSGASITLAIVSGTGTAGAALSCNTNPLTASAGVASYGGCKINLAGTNYQLRASATIGGNPFSATSSAFDITVLDNSAPTIDCTVPDQSIWYGSDVTVNCTASDASGLANSADASFSLSTSVSAGTETASAQTNSHQVCDNLNNCATAGPYTFKVDKKAPTFSCGAADGLWHASDVSIACNASDGGSGVSPTSDASFSLSTNVAAGTENANASTGTKEISDGVGNNVTAGPIAGNKVDKKAPTVSCGAADGLWHADDVSIGCTASDAGSGLANAADASFNLTTSVAANTETANASTDSHDVADGVGNKATAGPISGNKVDKKAPTFSCDSPDGVWHAGDVTLNCTASDGGSGVSPSSDENFSLSTNVPAGTETNNASTGTKDVSDAVGNKGTAGPISGNWVDKKGPVVALTCPAVPIIIGAPTNAGWTATDGGSGVASGYASGNIALETGSVGPKTATAPAGTSKDNVDNNSLGTSCNYSVAYGFDGLFAPVDRPTVMNVSKAGQGIPLKWRLTDYQGAPILNFTGAALGVAVSGLQCAVSATLDQIEEYAGNSGLQNLGDGYYQFNWKTPGTYANTCKSIGLNLGEGSVRGPLAYFTFKK